MKSAASLLAVGAVLTAAPALAQSQSDAFTIHGEIGAYSTFSGSENYNFVFGDVDMAYMFGSFGLDVSAVGIAEETGSRTAFFGGLSYTFGNGGKVTVGAPRSAYDGFGTPYVENVYKQLAVATFFGKLSVATSIEMTESDLDMVGVRYSSSMAGPLTYAVAYQELSSGSVSLDVYSGGVSYAPGPWAVSAGFEKIDSPLLPVQSAKITGTYDFGQMTAKVFFSSTEYGPISFDYTELSGNYQVTDKIDVGGMFGQIAQPGSDTELKGLNAAYTFYKGARANLAVFQIESSDPIYELSVSMKF